MASRNVETYRAGREASNQRSGTSTPGGQVVDGDPYHDQVSLLTQLVLMPHPPNA